MPETPTPGVNGHVVSSPALQASMSMLSFAPAASEFGMCASTASAGSFCLFCENGVDWLPVLTSVSGLSANAAGTATVTPAATTAVSIHRRRRETKRFIDSPLLETFDPPEYQ